MTTFVTWKLSLLHCMAIFVTC